MRDAREQYLSAWQVFVALAESAPPALWDAPTPCADWTVQSLVGHVVDGARQVQAMLTGENPPVPLTQPEDLDRLAGTDPGAVAQQAADSVESALSGLPAGSLVRTPGGELPLQQVLAMALIEPVIHGWDLAVATAQPVTFDEDTVAALLAGVQQLGDQLAATGMYAPARFVADQAPLLERLMAALGRAAG